MAPLDLTHDDARAAHCWFDVDKVAGDAASTAWKRLARWRQARWRQARGYPIGAQPYRGGDGSRLVGSRLALDFAASSGANFLTPGALAAALIFLRFDAYLAIAGVAGAAALVWIVERRAIGWGAALIVAAASAIACVLPWPRPRQASLMSACSGPMLPRPGPPRITLTKTPGSSAPIM